jgi:hypothetical protein
VATPSWPSQGRPPLSTGVNCSLDFNSDVFI